MPKVSERSLVKIHIRLEQDDKDWLVRELGGEKLIAATIRRLIKRLRGVSLVRPELNLDNLLELEELDLQ